LYSYYIGVGALALFFYAYWYGSYADYGTALYMGIFAAMLTIGFVQFRRIARQFEVD
jgi:hypothetical protein